MKKKRRLQSLLRTVLKLRFHKYPCFTQQAEEAVVEEEEEEGTGVRPVEETAEEMGAALASVVPFLCMRVGGGRREM